MEGVVGHGVGVLLIIVVKDIWVQAWSVIECG